MMKQQLKSLFWRFLPLFILIAVLVGFFGLDRHQYLNLEQLAAQKEILNAQVVAYPCLSVVIFVAIYIVVAVVSLPGATVLSISAGLLFGRWLGTGAVVVGATMGAVCLFWVVQTTLGEGLKKKAGPWFNKIADGFQEGAVSYLLFLRLVPLFPFFAVNIVGAMMGVKAFVFTWTTALGIVPGAFIYVSAGVGLDSIVAEGTIFTPEIALTLTGLGFISLIPIVYRFCKARKTA